MIRVTHQQTAPSLSEDDEPMIGPGQKVPFALVTSLFFWGHPKQPQ
jgi:hypothetical protein